MKPLAAKDLGHHPLIGWDESATRIGAADWLQRVAPHDAVVYRTASLVNQLAAAKAGVGLAVLPCYLGDPDPDLARALRGVVPELATELWIVTHEDLKSTARVRAFFELVGGGLAGERDLLEGRGVEQLRPARRSGARPHLPSAVPDARR